jgi:predicted MFS family arabinose efflux permease
MYVKDVAIKTVNVDPSSATILISIVGAANTAGRIVSGWIADRPEINVLLLNNVSLTILGLATAVVPFLGTYTEYIVFAVVFGLAMGNTSSLCKVSILELQSSQPDNDLTCRSNSMLCVIAVHSRSGTAGT